MKLASHNSLSGTGLKNWWLYPFYLFGLCQIKSVKKQFESGVRLFDIRINSRLDNILESAQGIFRFSGDIEKTLKYLESTGEEIWVRILLEQNYEKSNQDERDRIFQSHCEYLEGKYKGINFFGGKRKYDFAELYRFKAVAYEPRILELYSSVTSLFPWKSKFWRVLDDWIPWLYAFLMNRKNKEEFLGKDTYNYLMIDFV